MSQRDTDMLLRGWLDTSAPAAAPSGLLDATLARTGMARSRPGWVAGLIGEALPESHQTSRRQLLTFAVAAAVVAAMVVIGVQLANFTRVGQSNPTLAPTPGPIDWRGPIPRVPGEAAMIPLLPFLEGAGNPALTGPPDVSQPWIDITGVSVPGGRMQWSIQLAESPPKASGLDPNETLIAYGLVVETTGDDVADFVIGISNEASTPGDFRVWVTNLATGDTDERVGPPYGYPVEFSHPDEARPEDGPPRHQMVFTFLPGTMPSGFRWGDRYYAWASQTSGTEVIAWDYEPADGWPGLPEPSASMLPDLPLPGFGPAPPGQYGWSSAEFGPDGLHHVLPDGSETSLSFATFDCFPAAGNGEPVSMRVAGLDGLYLEPYEPAVTFGGPKGGETTGAYAMPIGDQTLCVYLTWDPTTPPDELQAGRKVVESIRGQTIGDHTIRINFTLPGGWDTG